MSYAYMGNGMDDFACIVGEIGSYSTKIGYAGEDSPRCHFRSTTAVLHRGDDGGEPIRSHDFLTRPLSSSNNNSNNNNNNESDWEIENPVDSASGLILPQPTQTATASSSSIVSTYLEYGCTMAGMTQRSQLPLLMIEKSYNPPPIRQTWIEQLFEHDRLPATFLARDAVCACYAVGRSTATVVDMGHRATVISPVYDGFVETKGILQSPVGGQFMDELVLETLDTLFRKDCMKKYKSNTTQTTTMSDTVMPLYQTRMPSHTQRGEKFHHLARLDLARQCKEEGSGAGVGPFGYIQYRHDDTHNVSTMAKELHQQYSNAPKTPYKLPDGTILYISQTLRFDVAECLFGNHPTMCRKRQDAMERMQQDLDEKQRNYPIKSENHPTSTTTTTTTSSSSTSHSTTSFFKALAPYLVPSSIGSISSSSIPTLICESVFKCDVDQQPQLLGNIVLCGGASCLTTSALLLHSSSVTVDAQQNSLPERVREEVEALIHLHTPGWRVKISSPGITERAICSWLGGSILGSLGTFQEMWITKAEYEEHGSSIVNRKCP